MQRYAYRLFVFLWPAIFLALPALALADQNPANQTRQSISQKTKGMKPFAGFFIFYWDEHSGRLWLQIDRWNAEFLYLNSLPAGVGSNDIGLDRGQLGGSRIVRFERYGPRVLLVQPNYDFRADSPNPAEQKAVRESFAQSVLWGFTVEAEEGGQVLVDATDFFLRDARDVAAVLKDTKQGDYHLDATRSVILAGNCRSFPRNSEVEALLTFAGSSPGQFVKQVVPSPASITVRQRHSFIQLPDEGYRPRLLDPRAGFFGISYLDFSAHVHEPLKKQFIARHRLQKKDPTAAVSEALQPIIYYVDNGAPEPIRSALIEGASWWSAAFEAAGFKNAFQVKVLPEDADPLDVRYNVIQWVHRATRGWSYGDAVVDPRSGEIIKGHVSLGSLRVRQDYLIAEGLLAPYKENRPPSPEMQEMALARLRQLAAHEVGHTLGLAHNFAASAHDRASVMDYPHPLVKIIGNDSLDVSDAYAAGIGEWDKVAIRYGYSEFADADAEKRALPAIIEEALQRGLFFISDADARPAGGAHPTAHLWDNGGDAAAELQHVLDVRRVALKRFSAHNVPPGTPLSLLEATLAPIYFFHRYQTEAAARLLGGMDYRYALRGDGQTPTEILPAEQQRAALQALLKTITPQTLLLPDELLQQLPPRAFGVEASREDFQGYSGVVFDPLAAAEAAADITVGLLLNPERAARLVEFHSRNAALPGLAEVIDRLLESTWRSSGPVETAMLRYTVDNVVLYHLMRLAAGEQALPQTRETANLKLQQLSEFLAAGLKKAANEEQKAHYLWGVQRIEKFFEEGGEMELPQPLQAPPGSPIGVPAEWENDSNLGN